MRHTVPLLFFPVSLNRSNHLLHFFLSRVQHGILPSFLKELGCGNEKRKRWVMVKGNGET